VKLLSYISLSLLLLTAYRSILEFSECLECGICKLSLLPTIRTEISSFENPPSTNTFKIPHSTEASVPKFQNTFNCRPGRSREIYKRAIALEGPLRPWSDNKSSCYKNHASGTFMIGQEDGISVVISGFDTPFFFLQT
jgi:hypothetical protein